MHITKSVFPPIKSGISILLLFFVANNLHGEINTDFSPRDYSIVPGSPQVAGLVEKIEYPVDYFHGTPTVNLPIYTLKCGEIEIPLFLSYSSGGIRVEQKVSNAGLGWTLFSGAAISHTVQGAPDDANEKIHGLWHLNADEEEFRQRLIAKQPNYDPTNGSHYSENLSWEASKGKRYYEEMTEATVVATHSAITETSYDNHGRPTKTTIQTDNNPKITIARYSYDPLGRLHTETGAVTTRYSYDIHSNITEILSDHFRQQAKYQVETAADTPISYTGINALTTAWFDGQDNSGFYSKSETFSYNGLGHYKSSITDNGQITEEIRTDLDANVLEIKRKYNSDIIQDAVLVYDGGKNIAVFDNSTPYWTDQVGRFPAGDYAIEYDSRGRIIKDETRGIESIRYQPFDNLPYKIEMTNGSSTTSNYFTNGKLHSRAHSTPTIQTITHITASGDTIVKSRPSIQTTRTEYFGNFERSGDNYRYNTPQGYYDLSSNQHYWFQRDRLGSTVIVYDSAANMLQTTAYYPSGTPHQLQSSSVSTKVDALTDQLHIGNHWLSHAGLNLYDNTARLHDPLLMHFGAPDPLYSDYPGNSPWSHTAANPINAVDPSGCLIRDNEEGDFSEHRKYIENQLDLLDREEILKSSVGVRLYVELLKKYFNEIRSLESSKQLYVITRSGVKSEGFIYYNKEENAVVIAMGYNTDNPAASKGIQAHEIHHAYQFEIGSLSIRIDDGIPTLYDIFDEVESYNIDRAITFGKLYFDSPEKIIEGYPLRINQSHVRNLNGGVYKSLPNAKLNLNKSTKQIIQTNNSGPNGIVEYYKGMHF